MAVRLFHVVALAAAAVSSSVARAADWETYHQEGVFVEEIDLQTVVVDAAVVRFKYRRHFASGRSNASFDNPVEGVADCAGRRYADYKSQGYQLLPVFEETVSAERLDAACRAAGRATRAATAAPAQAASDAAATPRDWRRVDSAALKQAIDARSIQVRDGRVFYTYANEFGRTGEQVYDSVVDCAARQQGDVVAGAFALHDINEQAVDAQQANLACQLAGLPTQRRTPTVTAPAWQVYFTRAPVVWELDANTVRVADGLVHFVWRLRFTEGSPTVSYPVDAVADCAGHRRSDVAFNKFKLRSPDDGTQEAKQLEFACGLAAAK